tara:strand:+ start:1194 stop:1448 length:255 start_codon:yes stop_codon:yes gene_type:complete
MIIVSHVFFSSNFNEGKEPFHTEHMDENFIPRKGNNVTYDDGVFKIKFDKKISLDFIVENVNYRYSINEENKLITFIDVILKSE